jgi:hypothetical protein
MKKKVQDEVSTFESSMIHKNLHGKRTMTTGCGKVFLL